MSEIFTASFDRGAKYIRMMEMLGSTLTELRELDPGAGFRSRLVDLHRRVLSELDATVPPGLDAELHRLAFDLPESASRDEVRVAQAQLVGWLEGLMSGVQVAVAAPADGADGADGE